MQFTTTPPLAKMNTLLLSIKQRYKLNAIHNNFFCKKKQFPTVVNKAKIQIECNSQQLSLDLAIHLHCCQ